MSIVKNRILRSFLFVLGGVSLSLGLIGAVLPLLPTTPFVLLAAWCFLKSSEQARLWLYRQPLIGSALTDWEERRAIKRSTKIVAIGMISVSIAILWLRASVIYIQVPVTLVLLAVSVFIFTRK